MAQRSRASLDRDASAAMMATLAGETLRAKGKTPSVKPQGHPPPRKQNMAKDRFQGDSQSPQLAVQTKSPFTSRGAKAAVRQLRDPTLTRLSPPTEAVVPCQGLALRQDAGKWAVLILALLAATAGLVVIAAEMPLVKNASGAEQVARVVFVIYTIVVSWAFIHTIFALNYAHDYYADADLTASGPNLGSQRLIFPGEQKPSYGDFLYFSFTIGMTFQVSDVQIADSQIRRVALLHGATVFFYSTGILALMINLVAGLI